ncbi:unnamed protein product [Cylindrotheca closterium]|uniref:Uncharacterized protein n=1 Tax=Cylindrotheca closterium TaxID=2856 RepID=A0AAD2JGJ0_9STRA|nr:unnamed protein product [Cylindrotheca closterium]
MQEWVNNPRFFTATYSGSSRGLLLCWHVFVPKAFARKANLILAANLDILPTAPVSDRSHAGKDSGDPSSDCHLGMLNSAATENFGKLTLLRFLLAVIVTGAQAKKAEEAEPQKPPAKALEVLSDSELSGDKDVDAGLLGYDEI